jgi:hypothetical protein
MTDTIPDLLEQVLLVFGERDDLARRAAIDRIFTADVVFSDAEGVAQGRDALDVKAKGILDEAPEFVFAETGPAREAQDLGLRTWGFGPAGQDPVVTGIDVITVVDGRVATLHTLLT